ncbi:MAG: choice-of-anchor L domain-containing protein [Gammaproteobacteria bacterium]
MTTVNLRRVLFLAFLLASGTAFAQGGSDGGGGGGNGGGSGNGGGQSGGVDDNPSADDLYVLQYGAEKEDDADLPDMTEEEIESLETETPATPPKPVTPPASLPPATTGNELVDAWVVPNSGILVNTSSITYIGASKQGAVYNAANVGTLIDTSGIVLTSGQAPGFSDSPTSNTSSGYTNITGTGASVEISSISKQWSYDQNKLSFSFSVTPGIDAVTTRFVFASEEYPEWTGIFKDGFALLVDGVNVARFDADNFVVLDQCSTNGVFPCTDTTQNDNGYFTANSGAGAQPLEYDGYTAVLTATGLLDLTKSTHTITAVVSDSRDPLWDSAIFLSQLRGLGGTQPPVSTVPVPAPLLLFGSALIATLARARRGRRA